MLYLRTAHREENEVRGEHVRGAGDGRFGDQEHTGGRHVNAATGQEMPPLLDSAGNRGGTAHGSARLSATQAKWCWEEGRAR